MLSLKVAFWATLLSLPLGILTAYALARWQFRGKQLLNGVVHLPLILPPVVTGYLLLSVFGRRGLIGGWSGGALAGAAGSTTGAGACVSAGGFGAASWAPLDHGAVAFGFVVD